MSRFFVILAGTLFIGSVQAQEACRPDYKHLRSACKPTGKIERIENTKALDFLAHEGACEIRDIMALCADGVAKLQRLYPTARPGDIRATRARPVARHDFCKVFQQKQDIRCDFEIQVPVMESVADESCPIMDVVDSNRCAEKDDVTYDAETVSGCLKLNPKSEEQWWNKAACLSDLSKAADSFGSTGINAQSADEIARQLDLAIRKTRESGQQGIHYYLVKRRSEKR